jgi:hypothetical protein
MKYLSFVLLSLGLVLFSCFDITDSGKDSTANKSDGNDLMSSATPYIVGQTTQFKLDRDNDLDYFKFTIDKAGLYFLNVSNIPSSISLWIYILDKEGTPILSRSPTSNDGSTISVGNLLNTGEYYVKFNASIGEYSNQEMTFTVIRDLVDTFEVNNTINTAYPITKSKYYRGTIYPENDLDYFSFSVDSNQIMRFQLDSVSSRITMTFRLLDNEGIELKTITLISSSQSMDIGYALKKGTYYVKLNAGFSELSATPYRFLFRKDTTDQTEWNDDTANAMPLTIGETTGAAIYPAGDIDYFKFSIGKSDTISINVDSVSSALPNFQFRLLDRDLTEQANSGYPTDGSIRFKKLLNAGTYYLKVYSGYSTQNQISFRKYFLIFNKTSN